MLDKASERHFSWQMKRKLVMLSYFDSLMWELCNTLNGIFHGHLPFIKISLRLTSFSIVQYHGSYRRSIVKPLMSVDVIHCESWWNEYYFVRGVRFLNMWGTYFRMAAAFKIIYLSSMYFISKNREYSKLDIHCRIIQSAL